MPITNMIVDDADDLVNEPSPGDKPKQRGRPKGSTNRRSRANVEKEAAEQMTFLLKMVSGVWSTRDQFCGQALNRQSAAIANELAHMVASSAKLRKYLDSTLELGRVIPLAAAIMPVAQAIYLHHVMPRPQEDVHADINANATYTVD